MTRLDIHKPSLLVSPSDLLRFQKAGLRRRRTLNRRKGSTRILIDTPVREKIAAASSARAKKKAKPGCFPTKRNLFEKPRELVHDDTSSCESESLDHLNDNSYSVNEHIRCRRFIARINVACQTFLLRVAVFAIIRLSRNKHWI